MKLKVKRGLLSAALKRIEPASEKKEDRRDEIASHVVFDVGREDKLTLMTSSGTVAAKTSIPLYDCWDVGEVKQFTIPIRKVQPWIDRFDDDELVLFINYDEASDEVFTATKEEDGNNITTRSVDIRKFSGNRLLGGIDDSKQLLSMPLSQLQVGLKLCTPFMATSDASANLRRVVFEQGQFYASDASRLVMVSYGEDFDPDVILDFPHTQVPSLRSFLKSFENDETDIEVRKAPDNYHFIHSESDTVFSVQIVSDTDEIKTARSVFRLKEQTDNPSIVLKINKEDLRSAIKLVELNLDGSDSAIGITVEKKEDGSVYLKTRSVSVEGLPSTSSPRSAILEGADSISFRCLASSLIDISRHLKNETINIYLFPELEKIRVEEERGITASQREEWRKSHSPSDEEPDIETYQHIIAVFNMVRG